MTRSRLALVVLLALAGGALSGLLLFDHHGVGAAAAAVDGLCGTEEESGCDEVSQSPYSSVGQLSVAAVGIAFYGSVLLLLALGLVAPDGVRESVAGLALAVFGAALVADVVLLLLQTFAIGAYCRLCIATYAVNAASFAVLFPAKARFRALPETLVRGEGRRSLVVWALGSLVVLVGVAAIDRGFASGPSEPPANLLGEAPPPPPLAPVEVEPEPEPTEPAETTEESTDERVARLEQELARSRERARELQGILDDPQKYEEYQTQKAAHEFEREKPRTLALDGVPFKGPAEAPIRVVEYSDFLCPFCRSLAGAFSNYMPQSQGRVAIYYKNYPLDQACNPSLSRTVHDGACELALGAVCAHEQGKFWPYHDAVFSTPPQNPKNEDVLRIAASAGLDSGAMRACLDSSAAKQKLDREIQEARGLEVSSTPTVYVNGKKLGQIGGFLLAIESEAKRLGLPVQGQ
jgi:serine/threonine-protein kinase